MKLPESHRFEKDPISSVFDLFTRAGGVLAISDPTQRDNCETVLLLFVRAVNECSLVDIDLADDSAFEADRDIELESDLLELVFA